MSGLCSRFSKAVFASTASSRVSKPCLHFSTAGMSCSKPLMYLNFLSTKYFIFILSVISYNIMDAGSCQACCLPLEAWCFGQAPPARAEAIVISDLTPDPIPDQTHARMPVYWIRAQGQCT